MNKDDRPWWADHIPDLRACATVAMFALVFYVLWLIASYPALKENELFKTVATLLIGSGAFGLVCAFLWGGSKASVAAAETVNKMAQTSTTPTQTLTVEPDKATATTTPGV